MNKRRMIELAACGTGMLLFAGAALADIPQPAQGSGARAAIQPNAAAPQAAAAVSAPQAASVSGPQAAAAPAAPAKMASAQSARPVHRAAAVQPSDAIGREIVDAQGETVGPVRQVVGDRVVFPVSDAMGFSAHNVAVKWSDISKLGSGSGGMLQVRMSADDLRNLPAYQAPSGT